MSSFVGEEKEMSKFKVWSEKAEAIGKLYQKFYSIMVGIIKFSVFFFYSYAFFIGSKFVEEKRINE